LSVGGSLAPIGRVFVRHLGAVGEAGAPVSYARGRPPGR